jgi:hypothetical protein
MRRIVASLVIVGVALGPARADDDQEKVAAQVHLDRGVAKFQAGDYAGAHAELLIAHDLAPDKPNPYRWLALTEAQLDDCPSALLNIDEFLKRVSATDERRPEMIRLRALCARVEPAPTAAPIKPAPREDSPSRRWWIWPVAGAAVLAIIGGSVYLATRGDDEGLPVLPPIDCTGASCE